MKDKLTTKQRLIWLVPIIIILSILAANAQPVPHKFFVSGGADLKMLVVGVYPERDNPVKGLDFKTAIGFEFPNSRVRMELQAFKELGFLKWTWLAYDIKRESFIKNIYWFAGLEVSSVKRHHADFNFKNPDNYREFVITRPLLGANLEAQYKYKSFGFSIQLNVHQAEEELKPYKDFRFQVHTSFFYFF